MHSFLPCSRFRLWMVVYVLTLICLPRVQAQADKWDSLLADSYWYVPGANLLAYLTSGTSFANPTEVGDQTLWNITSATNGVFTGSSMAYLGINHIVSTTSSQSMQGVVTESGQIRIVFTQDSATTIGIGQMQTIDDITYMQMQMMTGEPGEGGVLVTHWAYMKPYDPDNFTPPLPATDETLRSVEWQWMLGTTWSLSNDELFGENGTGTFSITGYRNGYFWGSGTGPEGSPAESFTQLGSVTPEGTVLFNIMANSTLTSLTGQITGNAGNGQMALRHYDGTDFGNPAFAQVIPEPGMFYLLGLAGLIFSAGLVRRRKITGNLDNG